MTMLGLGGCNTKKAAIEPEQRQKAEQSMRDSIEKDTDMERIGRSVLLYGVPNMIFREMVTDSLPEQSSTTDE